MYESLTPTLTKDRQKLDLSIFCALAPACQANICDREMTAKGMVEPLGV